MLFSSHYLYECIINMILKHSKMILLNELSSRHSPYPTHAS